MTDTPLTDEFCENLNDFSDVELRQLADFARKLERDLMQQCKLLAISADREEKLRDCIESLVEAITAAIKAGDWKVDGACDPDMALKRAMYLLQ